MHAVITEVQQTGGTVDTEEDQMQRIDLFQQRTIVANVRNNIEVGIDQYEDNDEEGSVDDDRLRTERTE